MDNNVEISLYSYFIYVLVAYFGVWWHWRKMLNTGRVSSTKKLFFSAFWHYLFMDYPGSTFGVGVSILLVSWTAAMSGVVVWLEPQLLVAMLTSGKINIVTGTTVGGVVSGAFLSGYGLESILNKGAKQVIDNTKIYPSS